MAMNPMQRKTRNAFLLGFIAALIVGGIGIALLFMQLKNKNAEIDKIRAEMNVAMSNVYVISKDVREDEPVEVQMKSIPTEYVPSKAVTSVNNYMDDDGELVMKSKVALTKGTIITEDMVENNDETKSYRMVEYSMISLPSLLQEGDLIDIRLAFPDGGNYVVLSKIEVESCTATTIWLKITENEMLRLDEAALESYIIDGTKLYATQYVDAAQHDLYTTYVPSELVANIIKVNSTAEEIKQLEDDINQFADVRDNIIEAYLKKYQEEEKVEKVTEGFQSQKSLIQANRAELLGEMGY